MGLEPAVTDLEHLKDHPALSLLLAWNTGAITEAKFDRNELSIYLDRANIKEALELHLDGMIRDAEPIAEPSLCEWIEVSVPMMRNMQNS